MESETTATSTTSVTAEDIRGAKSAIEELIKSSQCHPIMVRLGWHDAGTYDKDKPDFPSRGGANGSIRFLPEKGHGSNAGLDWALDEMDKIKEKNPSLSYADLFQLASATAIELTGGPKIEMKYGRVDAPNCDACPAEGNLPDAGPKVPAEHLRKIFYRMGFNDQEIVALSGAHTIGRSRVDRSGWGKEKTKYTENGPGKPGGQSWTSEWLKFDNSYFKDIKEKTDAELLVLPTDAVIFEDEGFKPFAEKYLNDEKAFFDDYAKAHKKLSELGAKFDPPEGIVL